LDHLPNLGTAISNGRFGPHGVLGLAEFSEPTAADWAKTDVKCFAPYALCTAVIALSACATPAQMHSEGQLNSVALGCGLALGELMQDESEKKLLLTVHQNASPQQRLCVARWARRNGLKAVFVNMQFPAG
jgi:hypothetical protein